jgi:hypothetical protein
VSAADETIANGAEKKLQTFSTWVDSAALWCMSMAGVKLTVRMTRVTETFFSKQQTDHISLALSELLTDCASDFEARSHLIAMCTV